MININKLLDCSYNFQIEGITDDSRNVHDNYLFVATKGFNEDHFNFIEDAINNGAICIVADREVPFNIPSIIIDDINDSYISLCERFYDVLATDFNIIGITGTDGKTTTANIIWQLMNKVEDWACIGTNGVLFKDLNFSTNNTTPCISELYKILSILKKNKCKNIVMEVSSEALLHDRLKRFKFHGVVFTNITEDHLNVHKTIKNYIECKLKLLDLLNDDSIIIKNNDDVNSRFIRGNNLYSIGRSVDSSFFIGSIVECKDNVNFTINYDNCYFKISSPYMGLYNVYNVSMAFSMCLLLGMNVSLLIKNIGKLNPVPGRREYIDFGQSYDIILDYAHTYNGIKNILESVSNYKNIIVVTGAAGGREKEKRSKIGKLILDKASIAIFTMDDPRYESVDDIIDQMVSNSDNDYIRITDRKDAIIKGLSMASEGSVVLILGKGRDSYMAIDDKKIYYNDFDSIAYYFKHN